MGFLLLEWFLSPALRVQSVKGLVSVQEMTDISKLKIERNTSPSQKPRRSGFVLYSIVGVVLLALLYVGFRLWLQSSVSVTSFTVTQAYPSQSITQLNATGYVVAQRKAAVASKATGRLEWLGVREGSIVKSGQVLARLENQDVLATREQADANILLSKANLEQAQSELKESQRAFDRSRDLVAKRAVSEASHDSAQARLEKARAAVTGAEASIAVALANRHAAEVAVEQTQIRAPFDSVVLTKNANVGDVITPFSSALGSQAAVVTMADMSTLEVEADVSESNLSQVLVGQPCEIQLDAIPKVRFSGEVLRLVPTVDRAKATVMVKIRFIHPDKKILPEMSAKVAFLSQPLSVTDQSAKVVVPPEALTQRDGRPVVFVIREGKAVQTPIETGPRMGNWVSIRSGLTPGQSVIVSPTDSVRDGLSVSLKK